jgi:glutaredoxin
LKNNDIKYVEKDVSQDENRETLLRLGYRTTPVVVSQKGTVVGYNPTKLSEVLL